MATDRGARARRRPGQLARCALVLASILAAGSTPAAAPFEDTIAQRVLACTGCHGKEGPRRARRLLPAHRRQAGRLPVQPAAQFPRRPAPLRADERAARAARRRLPARDRRLLRVARSALPAAAARRRPAALLEARRGARAPTATRRAALPACDDCHGAALTGVAPAIPGLLGLPRDYLNAQLGAWRTGQRRALAPDCMAQVAQRLSPEDIGAVSALARRAAGARPCDCAAPRLPTPLPIACGGVRRRGGRRQRPGAMKRAKASVALAVVAAIVLLAAIAGRAGSIATTTGSARPTPPRTTGTAASSSRAASTWCAPAAAYGCHTERAAARPTPAGARSRRRSASSTRPT